MNCFECAKAHDDVPAVGVAGTAASVFASTILIAARDYRVGGTTYGCAHTLPSVTAFRGVPAGIAAAARHHTAGVA